MARRTTVVLAGAGAVLLAYLGLLAWLLARRDLPGFGVGDGVLLVAAVAAQFAGVWCFGALFRDGLARSGTHLRPLAAFRAALIGAGVARLLPVGGAITPVAMAWSARSEAKHTSGAAIRSTVLNYAGLLVGTGAVLVWIQAREPIAPEATGAALVGGLTALMIGLALMFGSSRLGSLVGLLPGSLGVRFRPAFHDHAADATAQGLVWARLGFEAAVLWAVFWAFDIRLTPTQAFATFGLGQLASGLPGTPGGLGFAEAGLVGALALFGIPAEIALSSTLVYRLVSYWLPVGAGLVAGGQSFLAAREAGLTGEADPPSRR
ncbi:MAG: flippase-like domain-containing protein [Acidimicrobiia bacterium]